MNATIKLFSNKIGEISNFLSSFFNDNLILKNDLFWQKNYENPIEIADIIGVLIESDYNINMWISLDKDVLINVTNTNADNIIRYLFERYPY